MGFQTLETVAVALTPPGRGAVATVRIDGPRATECVEAQFKGRAGRRPLADVATNRVLVGKFGSAQEEVVLCRCGETSWEVHCHGGQAASAMIMSGLVAAGCTELAWPDWLSSRAPDPIQAEAHQALSRATTQRTAGILLDQYHGALGQALDELDRLIAQGASSAAAQFGDALLERAQLGLHLTQPWQVVLAGRPNVGKSSLINALAGYQRSIVFDQPGTTRDVVTAATAIDGWPVLLADTAGLRPVTETIEAAGIEEARARMRSADLVVLVFDASQDWSSADEQLTGDWPQALRVFNKADLVCDTVSVADHPAGLLVSAQAGFGIETLVRAIGQRLVPKVPVLGSAVPFLPRHVADIRHRLAQNGSAGSDSTSR